MPHIITGSVDEGDGWVSGMRAGEFSIPFSSYRKASSHRKCCAGYTDARGGGMEMEGAIGTEKQMAKSARCNVVNKSCVAAAAASETTARRCEKEILILLFLLFVTAPPVVVLLRVYAVVSTQQQQQQQQWPPLDT